MKKNKKNQNPRDWGGRPATYRARGGTTTSGAFGHTPKRLRGVVGHPLVFKKQKIIIIIIIIYNLRFF
jgi:hypothetical protein